MWTEKYNQIICVLLIKARAKSGPDIHPCENPHQQILKWGRSVKIDKGIATLWYITPCTGSCHVVAIPLGDILK